MENPRKCSGLMSLLTYRSSIFACFPLTPALTLAHALQDKAINPSSTRTCIFQVPHDGQQFHRHAPGRSRKADVCSPSQQAYRGAQEQLHPRISAQNKSACEPGCDANYSPDRQMPQTSRPKIFFAYWTLPAGHVIDPRQLYQDARTGVGYCHTSRTKWQPG